MKLLINYFTGDPLRILYIIGGSGGVWFWINEWRFRTRLKIRMLSETFDPVASPNLKTTTTLEVIQPWQIRYIH